MKKIKFTLVILGLIPLISYAESSQHFHCDPDSKPKEIFNIISFNETVKSKGLRLVKYNCETGETMTKGKNGWKVHTEKTPIPKSIYYIRSYQALNGKLSLIRVDMASGKTWVLGKSWSEY